MASPYRPPRRSRPGALLRVTGIAAAAALMTALVWHLSDRYLIELVVLAPALVGLGIGLAIAGEVRRAGLSSPRAATVLATIAVLLALGVHLGLRYRQHREARLDDLRRVHDVHVAVGLVGDRPHPEVRVTPASFLRHRFGLGANIDPMSGLPAALGPVGTIAIFGIEVLLCLGIAIVVARMSASEPACPRCGSWRVHARLADAGFGVADDLVARLLEHDAAAAAALVSPPDTRERVRLAVLSCPAGHDDGGGVLRVMEHRRDRRRRERARHVADLCVSEAELDTLRAAVGAGR
jgi:hypothetical protein